MSIFLESIFINNKQKIIEALKSNTFVAKVYIKNGGSIPILMYTYATSRSEAIKNIKAKPEFKKFSMLPQKISF